MNHHYLKNLAIVAHVDHGKTTLIDGLIKQSETLKGRETITERQMDSGDLEKERGITITAKNCAINWHDYKINLLDTPGHADFGGEVERSLMMVDGVLLLVDAAEGPLPQTRFVLTKAMELGHKIGVIINKIDRPDERIEEVKGEIEDLFLDIIDQLQIDDYDLDIPILYSSAKEGWATTDPTVTKDNLNDILDFMVSDFFHEPRISEGPNLQLLITNLSYSNYLGPLIVGRIQRGSVEKLQNYALMDEDGKNKSYKISSIQIFDSVATIETDKAEAGEIVILAGVDGANIGDTLVSRDALEALPRISVEPPTVSVNVSVSTSPFSGQEGDYLTSRKLEEYFNETCMLNVALQYEATDDPKVYKLKGRGELQLAIVFEELRRKGFEFMVARPEVVFKKGENGEKQEPYEVVVVDVPSENVGTITEALSLRKGKMVHMHPMGTERTRIDFEIPSRGMIGYRGQFLTDTRGEGLMSSQFLDYRPYAGDMLARKNGAIISDRAGKITPYALFNLLPNGAQYVVPGDKCYEGMVIGEHNKTNDTNVNCVREKHLAAMRTAGKDVNIVLPPVAPKTIEWAMDWIDNDEWVEVTPKSIRIRKKILKQNERSVQRSTKKDKK